MHLPRSHLNLKPPRREQGQALVEYVLIVVLVAIIFGFALGATGPVIGNVFSNSINDLLRQTEPPFDGTYPGRENFWETVTAAFENPPEEQPIPSNTPAPPTTAPTDGPSPTPSETFTVTPITPTITPSLTPTPTDAYFDWTFYDSVEKANVNWWRLDANMDDIKNTAPWTMQYYDETFNTTIGDPIPGVWSINFSGDASTPWVVGKPATNYGVRFERELELDEAKVIALRLFVDDGIRVTVDGNPVPDLDNLTRTATQPLWYDGSIALQAGVRYTIRIDYIQRGGGSRLLALLQTAGSSPADINPVSNGQAFLCGWGQNFRAAGNDANTEIGMFDEFVTMDSNDDNEPDGAENNGDYTLEASARCHLELRGLVTVPAGAVNPQLTFWDVWDLKNGVSASIEIGQYIKDTDPVNGTPAADPTMDRASMRWARVDLHSSSTRNYNYTRRVIYLRELQYSDGTPVVPPGQDVEITFRFIITNNNNTSANNRWYIDDIRLDDAGAPRTFRLDTPTWTLDNDTQMDDFIRTGGKSLSNYESGWRLTSVNKLGPSGMSWHESFGPSDLSGVPGQLPYTRYKRFSETSSTNFEEDYYRYHTLEFNGWIDLDPSVLEDDEGNKGLPALTFYQGYDLGPNTGLEVQWTTSDYDVGNPDWRTFPDGLIRPITATDSITSINLQEKVVRMKDFNLPSADPPRIRVRFVMKVHNGVGNNRRDGWWIDQIRIGREESPKWLDYPFFDGAEYFTSGPWRYQGLWTQTSLDGRRHPDDPTDPGYERRSYGSAPGGLYVPAQKTWMEGRYAVDLYNDTQDGPDDKVIWQRPNTSDPENTHGVPAQNPVLTFWHTRDLRSSDNFRLQWKRVDEPNTSWRTLWFYNSGMGTTAPNSETLRQHAWERVEVDLKDMMDVIIAGDVGGNYRDDDVVFRFYLDAVSTGTPTGEGIYVDDIRMFERPDPATTNVIWKLWPANENRNDPFSGNSLGNGNGIFLTDDADASSTNRIWTESWFNGGDWDAVNWAGARVGVFAFHDSSEGQTAAPNGITSGGVADEGDAEFYTVQDRFAVMEFNQIIDLRAVNSVTEAPILYFWTRHHLGGSNKLRVEISTELDYQAVNDPWTQAELDSNIRGRCANQQVRQCYEQQRGWSQWTTPSSNGWTATAGTNAENRSYGWTRGQVDLSSYAYSVEPGNQRRGKRIRIRFVYDSLTNNTNPKDGWYLDNITIRYTKPAVPEDHIIADGPFDQQPTNMLGVLGEGSWGLDPSVVEGSSGSPSSFGIWSASWWNCNDCANLPGASGNYGRGAGIFLEDPDRPTPDYFQAAVTGINYNMPGRPPGAPGSFPSDRFVAEFVLDTPPVGGSLPPGNKSLLLTSDDGVRAKYYEIDGSGNPIGPIPAWNIVENWRDQSPTTVSGPMTFIAGRRYRIVIQYYEKSGGAVIIANLGEGKYSFSDSPKLGGAGARDAYPLSYANTSLVITKALDLNGLGAQVPILIYRTRYRIGAPGSSSTNPDTYARVEISRDGGFTWEIAGGSNSPFSNPVINNAIYPTNGFANAGWEQRLHDLSAFRGSKIIIRFRMDRSIVSCLRTKRASSESVEFCEENTGSEAYTPGYYDGWWISRITVTAQ